MSVLHPRRPDAARRRRRRERTVRSPASASRAGSGRAAGWPGAASWSLLVLVVARRRLGLAGVLLLRARRAAASRSTGTDRARPGARCAARPPCPTGDAAGPRRPRRDRARGSSARRRSSSVDVTRQLAATRVRIDVDRARRRSRWSSRRRRLRGTGRRRRAVPRLPDAAAPACRWSGSPADAARRRARRGGRGHRVAAARTSARQVDHVEVRTVDKISLVLRDGRTVRVGERGRLRRQGRGARRAAAPDGRVYDVSVPASRSPAAAGRRPSRTSRP